MINLETPSALKTYLKDKATAVFAELNLEKGFFRSFNEFIKTQVKADRVFIILSVEGEPAYTPGATTKNQMLVQMAIMDLCAKKDDFDAIEQAKADTYVIAWKLLQSIFQDYSNRDIVSFKIDGSRILPLESEDATSYFGSLLYFRVTGLAPTSEEFYQP